MGEVSFLVKHIRLRSHGDQTAESGEEVAGEQNEDPDESAGNVCKKGFEIIAQEEVPELAHIRQRENRRRQRGNAHGNADDRADDNADEDGAADLVRRKNAHDDHSDQRKEDRRLREISERQTV